MAPSRISVRRRTSNNAKLDSIPKRILSSLAPTYFRLCAAIYPFVQSFQYTRPGSSTNLDSNGLAYLEELSSGRVIGFFLNQLQGFKGETFKESGVVPGAIFAFDATSDGRIISVTKKAAAKAASAN